MKKTDLITKDVLSEIREINKRCAAMHIPTPPISFIELAVKDGDQVKEVYRSKANSWVRNAYNLLAGIFLPCTNYEGSATFGAGSQSVKDTDGTTRRAAGILTIPYTSSNALSYYCNGTVGSDTRGIVVGTSNDAESFESNQLGAIIANGTGTGQLQYGEQVNPVVAYDAGTKKWTSAAARTFVNGSGASISVAEIGWIFRLYYSTSNTYFMLMRDLLSSPVSVGTGQTLTATYTTEITYPY